MPLSDFLPEKLSKFQNLETATVRKAGYDRLIQDQRASLATPGSCCRNRCFHPSSSCTWADYPA